MHIAHRGEAAVAGTGGLRGDDVRAAGRGAGGRGRSTQRTHAITRALPDQYPPLAAATCPQRGCGAALEPSDRPAAQAYRAATGQVRRWIIGKDPRQYGFEFGLWSRLIVAALIAAKFGVSLGLTAVGR